MLRHLAPAALLALATSLAAPGAGARTVDLVSPWPEPAAIEGIEGRSVSFPSSSPFVISDVGKAARDPRTAAQAELYLPRGASARAPVPAVILLHGASGVSDRREGTYARQFAARGVAALVIDVFGARRDRGAGFIDRLMNVTEAMALADAYAGLHYLASLPQVDGKRVALIGFSYGGMVTTYAAYDLVAQRFAKAAGERFAAHVAFYAPCIATFRDNRTTGAPLLMLYGGKDGIIDPARCKAVAAELEDGGTKVRTVVYPNAYHKWDGAWGGPYRIGRTLAGCRFVVDRDGDVFGGAVRLPMTNSLTRKLILGTCAGSEGYLIGRDDAVRAKSNLEMGRFLQKVFNGAALD